MKIFSLQLVLLLVLLAANCSRGDLVVTPHIPGSGVEGVVYHLPKTLLRIEIPFTITTYEELVIDDGNRRAAYRPRARADMGEVAVIPIQVPDPARAFEIKTDVPASFMSKGSFSMVLTEEGFLSSSRFTHTDASLSFLQNLAGLVSKVLRPAGAMEVKGADADLYHAYQRLVRLAAKASGRCREYLEKILASPLGDKVELDVYKKGLDLLLRSEELSYDRLQATRLRNRQQRQVAVIHLVDPGSKPQPKGELLAAAVIDRGNCRALDDLHRVFESAGLTAEGLSDRFWLGIYAPPDSPPAASVVAAATDSDDTYRGYVYRVPSHCLVRLREHSETGKLIKQDFLFIGQFGPLAVLPVEPRWFADRKFEISLHPGTGGLASLAVSSEQAPAESVSEAALDITGTIRDLTGAAAEVEKLHSEIELLKAKIDKLEYEKKLKTLEGE